MIGAISTALTGLLAASKRAEGAANNIANVSSTDYRATTTVQTAAPDNAGTQARNIPKTPVIVNAYAPDSPFANADGMVSTPDVDLAEEAVNLKLAEIAYKANASTIKTADEMSKALLDTFDKKA